MRLLFQCNSTKSGFEEHFAGVRLCVRCSRLGLSRFPLLFASSGTPSANTGIPAVSSEVGAIRVSLALDTRLFRVLNRPEAGTALAGGVSHQLESTFKTKGRRPAQFLFADSGMSHGGANTIAFPRRVQCQRSKAIASRRQFPRSNLGVHVRRLQETRRIRADCWRLLRSRSSLAEGLA